MRLARLFWIVMFVCAASALYSVKYRVQEMDAQIAALEVQIDEEKTAIHVLNAEWTFLTRPDRVRRLAEKHLDLAPAQTLQIANVADVPFPDGGAVQVVDGRGRNNGIAPVRYVVPEPSPKPQFRAVSLTSGGGGYVR